MRVGASWNDSMERVFEHVVCEVVMMLLIDCRGLYVTNREMLLIISSGSCSTTEAISIVFGQIGVQADF